MKMNYQLINSKTNKKLLILAIFIFILNALSFPSPLLADEIRTEIIRQEITNISLEGFDLEASNSIPNTNNTESILINDVVYNLPVNTDKPVKQIKVKSGGLRLITAYNSDIGQTDDDPCTTANGFNLCKHAIEDSVAANFLPFGAKVKIPDLFGDKIFIVRDRMNSRFKNRVDVWMVEKGDAIRFGAQVARIEILED